MASIAVKINGWRMKPNINNYLDSNNFSIGIHSFKVLVQIHYSHSPSPQDDIFIW